MKVLVTGGAGFIGSNIVERLLHDGIVPVVVDNFSTGQWAWVPSEVTVIKSDVLHLSPFELEQYDTIIHCQAHADVRFGAQNLELDHRQNLETTLSLLRGSKSSLKHFIFTSSAVVYGDPEVIPTPETYSGVQTSIYGANKLASEAMIQAYASYFGFQWHIFRFVSFTGRHYHHGVVTDFVRQLKKDPTHLAILGDGNQKKSYLDVKDGVEGILKAFRSSPSGVFNLGHSYAVTVKQVAQIICEEMGLENVRSEFSGGDRGWVGDSPVVQLDCAKMHSLGWKPSISIEDSIRATVRELL